MLRGLTETATLALCAWLAAAAIEAAAWMPSAGRVAALALFLVATGGMLLVRVAWPAARWARFVDPIPDDEVALGVGRRFPEVGDRLLNWLQLTGGRHSEAPAVLVARAARALEASLAHVRFSEVDDYSGVIRRSRWLAAPAVPLVVWLVVAPGSFVSASARLVDAGSAYARPAAFTLTVSPGDVDLVKGADLRVEAILAGVALPTRTVLEVRLEGEDLVSGLELPVDSGRASHTFTNLRRGFRYRVVADEVLSAWFEARVIDRPVIGRLQVVLRHPAYTRRPPEALDVDRGDIAALPGTRVDVEAVVSGPEIATGRLLVTEAPPTPMRIDGRSVSGTFTVRRQGEWSVEVVSTDSVRGDGSVRYTIDVLEDAFPVVSWEYPVGDVELEESGIVPLGWRLADDFGFRAIALEFRLTESRFGDPDSSWSRVPLELADPAAPEQAGSHEWDVAATRGRDPMPGDVVAFRLRVEDNDDVSGPKAAFSPELRVTVPSLAERYDALREDQDTTEDELERLSEDAGTLREEFDRLREDLRAKPEADWQDRRAAERLEERRQELEESVESVAEAIEESVREMEENRLVSEETLELFRELQEVAREISSPELAEALRQLQEAMQQLDPGRMQEAMERFEFSEEQYRERLDRTLELFRSLRVQQELDETARRAEDLARTERDLAERTGLEEERREAGGTPDSTAAARLAEEQERAAEEMAELERRMEEARQRMQDVRNAPQRSMQDLTEQTRGRDLDRRMQENAQQLRNDDLEPARQGQQQMGEELEQLSRQLQQMRAGMQGQQMQVNVAALRRALDDVLALSRDQEALRVEVQRLSGENPRLRESAQAQSRLQDGLHTVTDTLRSLARQVPQMGRDIQAFAGESALEMGNAVEAMTERVPARAAGHQKAAMTQLNELALLLADLMDQMQNGQSGGSGMSMEQMMQQLQDMAGQQQELNRQIQQMLNDMAGNRLSQDAAERMRQMAEQQRRLRDELRELSRDRSLRNRTLGDLERIADQMLDTIEELQQMRPSARTAQRQQQILTRLLEATQSLQERGRERRRESRSGEDVPRGSPAALTPDERVERLRRDLIRALESGYAPDYRELIRRYFELLQREAGPGA